MATVPMTLTFLGTGTSCGVPTLGCTCEVCRSTDARDKRLRTAALLECGDTRILEQIVVPTFASSSCRFPLAPLRVSSLLIFIMTTSVDWTIYALSRPLVILIFMPMPPRWPG